MSMPYSAIYCERCDAKWTSMCLWGTFKYRLTDGTELYADRELGWCNICNGVAPIEKLPAADQIKDRVVTLRSEIDSLWHSSVIESVRTALSRERRSKLSKLRVDLTDANKWLELLEARTEPIKCMICGSGDVIPIRPSFKISSESYDFATENQHPGCGGLLRVRDSAGTRFAIVHPHQVYDGNGRILAEGLTDR